MASTDLFGRKSCATVQDGNIFQLHLKGIHFNTSAQALQFYCGFLLDDMFIYGHSIFRALKLAIIP